jgi:hypothetical protein
MGNREWGVGDGDRVDTAGEEANGVGLTPALDCSGDTARGGP